MVKQNLQYLITLNLLLPICCKIVLCSSTPLL